MTPFPTCRAHAKFRVATLTPESWLVCTLPKIQASLNMGCGWQASRGIQQGLERSERRGCNPLSDGCFAAPKTPFQHAAKHSLTRTKTAPRALKNKLPRVTHMRPRRRTHASSLTVEQACLWYGQERSTPRGCSTHKTRPCGPRFGGPTGFKLPISYPFRLPLVQPRGGTTPPPGRARGGISGLLARRRRSVLRHPKENKRATFSKIGRNPILARLSGRFDGVPYVHPRSEHICSP